MKSSQILVMTKILGVVNDLIFSVKLDSILKNHGKEINYYNSNTITNIDNYDIILVDMMHPNAFEIIKNNPNKCIAFGPHTNIAFFEKARLLGCNKVFPRSSFFEQLPSLI